LIASAQFGATVTWVVKIDAQITLTHHHPCLLAEIDSEDGLTWDDWIEYWNVISDSEQVRVSAFTPATHRVETTV